MATFTYSALKSDGSVAKGELSASDRTEAFRRLGKNGLQPVSLEIKNGAAAPTTEKAPSSKKEKKERGKGASKSSEKQPDLPTGKIKLKRSQIVLFTQELSDLLGAGLQLEPALQIMESRDELSNLKVVASVIRQQVRDGGSFASALRASSPNFGELYCSLAQAGEVSGALPTILKRQAQYLVKLQQLQSKVVVAMIYPICLMIAVLAVSILFVSFLMPQLVSLLDSMGRELPLAAKFLLGVSGFLQGYWWLVILLVMGSIVGFKKITTTPPYEEKWHEQQLKLPFMGGLLSRRFFVQYLETLANLVGNGLPLLKGLELTRNATMNLYGRSLLDKIIDAVGEGAALSRTMRKVGFFPPILTDMIAVGEQTGDLPTALNRAAQRYDTELEKQIERLSALMQPVILGVLAAIVGPMAYIMIQVIIESLNGF